MLSMNKLKKSVLLLVLLLGGCRIDDGVGYTDENGPYINVRQYEFTTEVGNPIDFSNITGYDDYDGLLKTSVQGKIDYEQTGDYYPQITCTDLSGNTTSVGITVHVVDSLPKPLDQPKESASPTPSQTPCTMQNAVDETVACDVVPPAYVDAYEKLYIGEKGEIACRHAVESGLGESCAIVTTNDGRFWGYGLKAKDTAD